MRRGGRGGGRGGGGVAADAPTLITQLLSASEGANRRVQSATQLLALIGCPDSGHSFAQQHCGQLLHAFEQLLHDRNEAVRRQAPLLLGSLGAALRPEPHPFCSWLVHMQRLTSSRQEVLPSGATRPSVWALLLQALHEALVQLQRAGAASCIAPLLPELESMAGACGEELLELGDLPRELLLRVMEHLPAAAVVSVPRPCSRLPYRPEICR